MRVGGLGGTASGVGAGLREGGERGNPGETGVCVELEKNTTGEGMCLGR